MFCGRNVFGHIATTGNLKKILLAASLGTIPLTLLLIFIKPEFFPNPTVMFAILMIILFFCGIGIAPYWPTLQVYGVSRMPEQDSTLLYIYFSAMGVPGCGFFTWIIGVLGDKFGLQGAFLLIPVSLVFYALIILIDNLGQKQKYE
jgi:fucose permease